MTNVSATSVKLFSDTLPLAFEDVGSGRPILVLHGGFGPTSVAPLVAQLSKNARTIVPTHPGFAGQPRPEWLSRVGDLALAYLAFIEKLNLEDVVVVGNSLGGWIAAELAFRKSPRIAKVVLINAVGIRSEDPELAITDLSKIPPEKRGGLIFHDVARFASTPPTPEVAAAMAEGQKAMNVYAGEPFMHDPALKDRLEKISTPALVLWGEHDGVVKLGYGKQFAASIPAARFQAIPNAGHFPQIEQTDEVVRAIKSFL